jgi:addiction module RelB/DinJ family antitoxin
MKSAILRTRVNAKRKSEAEGVLHKLGLSLGEAINLFLSQVSIQKGIPFPLTTHPHLNLSNATIEQIEERYTGRVPNATTRAALQEGTGGKKRYRTASAMLKALKG